MKKLILGLAIALAACGGKKDEKKTEGSGSSMANNGSSMAGSGSSMASGSGSATASGSGSTMAGSGSATASAGSGSAAGSDVAVPTETDFEADAKSKITDKNVTGELDKLEKDLGP